MRTVSELKFEGKRPMVQPTTMVSNLVDFTAKSRKKKFANHIINNTNIFTYDIALSSIVPMYR
jgi:hypothetical protein